MIKQGQERVGHVGRDKTPENMFEPVNKDGFWKDAKH